MPSWDETTTVHVYKFVGDNIDKTIRPRFQRHEKRVLSPHYFQGYALKDRVDLSQLSDESPAIVTPDPTLFIPLVAELDSLKEEMTILFARYELALPNMFLPYITASS